jgi:hypothetical protein
MTNQRTDEPELARVLLDRLARIEELQRAAASPHELLVELRALVAEAEAWAQAGGGDAAGEAVERIRSSLEPKPTSALVRV